ncbi:MAG: ion channel [Capsulimonadaceae bacterium]
MHAIGLLVGAFLVLNTFWEAFETIVLPRTVTRSLRITRLIYRTSWDAWRAIAGGLRSEAKRESWLGYFGPISLPLLLGFWAFCLVIGFGTLDWSLKLPLTSQEPAPHLGTFLYLSGTTFFTVGYGDVTPRSGVGRFMCVLEGGVGIGFLAVVIGYLPVLYQAFSRREVSISLLDARAGSPPSAVELLRRYKNNDDLDSIVPWLHDTEKWAADLLESHLSYPVLAYYRSQHSRESWLSSLTMVMDTCALIMTGVEGVPSGQARLTFAIARHAIVDIALIFKADPIQAEIDRLPAPDFERLRQSLEAAGIRLSDPANAAEKLREIRGIYEPFVLALSRQFLLPLPPWQADPNQSDNWETSAWHTVDRHHFSS